MLGNLSKVLFKSPIAFNNNINSNIPDEINTLKTIQVEKTENSFATKNSIFNKLYFREKDFWKKNYEPGINFNHNKRLSFYLNISPKKYKSIENAKHNINKNIGFNTINKKVKNSYLLTDSPKNNKGTSNNNFNIYKVSNSAYKNTIFKNNYRLNTDSNRKIGDKDNMNFFRNNIFKHIKIKNTENNIKKKYNFPSIGSSFKTLETVFQDNADNKLNSLILIHPKIKEQLKNKNRSMVGKRDYLMYLNHTKHSYQNPFYASMKIKEDINNYHK